MVADKSGETAYIDTDNESNGLRINLIGSAMPKKNTDGQMPCILEEQHELCRLLVEAGVPGDPKWTSLILYMRSLEYNEALNISQRASIQKLLLATLGDRDFSDAKYQTICRMQERIVTAGYRDMLDLARRESKALNKEFAKILGRRKGDVEDLGEKAVETVESGESPDQMVRKLRDSFREVVKVMDEDSSRLIRMANTDSLTGLANRRRFDDFIRESVTLALAERQPLCMLMGDLDHFKRINDTYGHKVGDQVLEMAAGCIRKVVSSSSFNTSLCARYGGEEFAVVLPGVELEDAVVLAERIRREVGDVRFDVRAVDDGKIHKGQAVTMSLGVGAVNPEWSDAPWDRLVEEADAALYKAKRSGRDRVESAAV